MCPDHAQALFSLWLQLLLPGMSLLVWRPLVPTAQQCMALTRLHGEAKTHPPAHPILLLLIWLFLLPWPRWFFSKRPFCHPLHLLLSFCFLICAPFPLALSSGSSYLTGGSFMSDLHDGREPHAFCSLLYFSALRTLLST